MVQLSFQELPALPETAVALDFETSDKYPDSACALGMVRMEGGKIVDTIYSLIRPPRPHVYYTEVHGLTWDMVKDAPTFTDLWPQFSAFMQGADYLVAHNATFDRRVLRGCCWSFGLEAPEIPFLDTLAGARKGLPLRHNRLNDVCDYLGIDLIHHQADSDAMGCAKIYLYLREHGMKPVTMQLK